MSYYSGICLEGLIKITKENCKVDGALVKIWTEHLPNTNIEWDLRGSDDGA
jgi:hypothetical protein